MKVLYVGSTSACLELENSTGYYAPSQYEIRVNGEAYAEGNTNVVSVFGLKPDKKYEVTVSPKEGEADTVNIRTKTETCCLNVKDFGAKGDGISDDTMAIQTAIRLMPSGGRLYFPEGVYLTLPIALKSCMTIEISTRAVIKGIPDRSRWPIIPGTVKDAWSKEDISMASFEGLEQDCYQSLFHAAYVGDIAIVGRGKIDGNGESGGWWKDFRSFPAARPSMFFCNRTENVTIHGITVMNSPSWNMHPFFSKNIRFLDLKITAPKDSPNTDAIDPESCDQVDIIGCRLSVGDDCIAIKSGKLDLAQRYHTPADHHVIRNCLMEFGHGAVTLGSELSAGIKNIVVSQCLFKATDRGLRIKSRRGRGQESQIVNVSFDNIRMEDVLTPIVINMFYNCVDPDGDTEYVWSHEKFPVDERTPSIGKCYFRDMECTGAHVAACYIDALPESPIDEVVLENISISFADDAKPGIAAMETFAEEHCRMGIYIDNVRRVLIKNVKLSGVDGDLLLADHTDEVVTENLTGE